jgi:Ca2+-transporting ATPase
VNAELPRFAEVPFDSDRKRMTTVHRRPDGGARIVCKGAPEAVLHPAMLADDTEIVASATVRAEEMASAGLRVLALAEADRPGMPAAKPDLE